jgi:hypothetical protein
MLNESQMRGFVEEALRNVALNAHDFTQWWYAHIEEVDEEGNSLWINSFSQALPILNHTLAIAYLVNRWGEGMGAMREEGVIALYKFIKEHEEIFSEDAAYKRFREEIAQNSN